MNPSVVYSPNPGTNDILKAISPGPASANAILSAGTDTLQGSLLAMKSASSCGGWAVKVVAHQLDRRVEKRVDDTLGNHSGQLIIVQVQLQLQHTAAQCQYYREEDTPVANTPVPQHRSR
ncbi:MAG: hypothetical protein AAGI72_05195 [Pseudomonadota bacterium]